MAKWRWFLFSLKQSVSCLFLRPNSLERFEKLGELVRWIRLGEYVEGIGSQPTNDFYWLSHDSLVCELKTTSPKYRTIRNRIQNAVENAEKHNPPVVKDVFIVDLGAKELRENLKGQLCLYNKRVRHGRIRKLFIMSNSGSSFVEIPLEK